MRYPMTKRPIDDESNGDWSRSDFMRRQCWMTLTRARSQSGCDWMNPVTVVMLNEDLDEDEEDYYFSKPRLRWTNVVAHKPGVF